MLRCGVGIQAARRRHRRRRHLERQAARRCPRPSWPCAPLRAAACAGLLEAAMAAGCVETGPGGMPMPGWPSRRSPVLGKTSPYCCRHSSPRALK